MKKTLLLTVFAGLLVISIPVYAATIPSEPVQPATTAPAVTIDDLLKLSPREFQQKTGKKLTFKERLTYRLLQWKLRKHYRKAGNEATPQQIKQGNLSLLFGIAAIILLFIPYIGILSIAAAIAGFILGIKSLKGNSNTAGLVGLILSSLVMFLFILAVAVISSIGWY